MWLARASAPAAAVYYRLRPSARPLFTAESLRVLQGNLHVDRGPAERDLGYAPRPLARTIADTLGWFRDAGLL